MPQKPLGPVYPLEVYRARQQAVLARMHEVSGGGVLVLPANPSALRNRDVEYPYRADSDFAWLTGFEEPEAVAVLAESGLTLFVRPRDKDKEIWNGRRAGAEGARSLFGAQQAFVLDQLDAELPKLLQQSRTLWYRLGGAAPEFDARIARTLATMRQRQRLGVVAPTRLEDPAQALHELRLRKAPEELASLRKAVELTRRGHVACMEAGRPGAHEHELHALLEREFRHGGGRGWGYYPIVATGANACTLHYVENDAPIGDGELVLIDAGAEVDLYTADVTRTFPASGRFTAAQRAAYEVVLRAADAVIEHTRPGATIEGLHELAVRELTRGLVEVGLLHGVVDELVKSAAHRRYYMHRTSHWLGLDVHDVGRYDVALEPGMVFTVEPGLYVAPDDEQAPPELRGTGIRIEDDVLVTPSGREVLTAQIPRTVADVERACARE